MRIGEVQARILLTGFYFLVVGPFALILRWKSNPLAIGQGTSRGWQVRSQDGIPAEKAPKQF